MSRQLLEYHPVMGYRFIPGLKARVPHESGGYLVRVNDAGFRCNHEVLRERPAGLRRILLFGDSFTAGDGVSNEKRYGDLLEQMWHRFETGGSGLQVLNFGLPGAGTDQHYLAWREFARDLEHDLLIIAVLVENIRRVVARYRVYVNDRGEEVCYAKPYYELQDGELVLRQCPPPKEPIPTSVLPEPERGHIDRGGRFPTLRRVVESVGLKDLAQRLTHYNPVPDYDTADSPAWQLMRAILARWIGESPAPVLLMPIPLYHHVEELSDASAYQGRLRELATACRCTLHDPLPELLNRPAQERRAMRYEKDVHLTPAGHAALAASLAPVVARMLAGEPE